jgi:ADP-ribose pyrophosphatase YjhB (NUDIX family)
MHLSAAISILESALGDPREGLPSDVFLFVSRITPLINVDLLIQDERGHTLLTWRDDEFFGAGWHIPGGIIRYKETFADRLRACAREELGVDVSFEPAPLLVSETIRAQKSRGHFVSLLYRCGLLSPLDAARRAGPHAPANGEWRWHDGCPPDLLDVQRHYAPLFHTVRLSR